MVKTLEFSEVKSGLHGWSGACFTHTQSFCHPNNRVEGIFSPTQSDLLLLRGERGRKRDQKRKEKEERGKEEERGGRERERGRLPPSPVASTTMSDHHQKMAMDGSDSHGDADTLAQYCGPDFKEYVLKEQLKWSLRKENLYDKWVFWSEQDHEIEPSLSLDNCADFNLNVCAIPKVRDNIRRALQKLMQSQRFCFDGCLFQFWAATKTLEGRTLLTTRYEPFALGEALYPSDRVPLCNYRMEMCRKYNCFYADAESGEEQLGLPGRVFLHQFPESNPKVEYYTTKEYPQRDLARDLGGSWAVPVFEHSGQTCVGVLEIVSQLQSSWYRPGYSYRPDEIVLDNVNTIFQDVGLQCFDGYKICKLLSRKNVNTNNSVFQELKELKTVMRLVCETHRLPWAMAWVPCSACDGRRTMGVGYCASLGDNYRAEFLGGSERGHSRKGWIAEKALSHPYMLYFTDISKLSIDEYPSVPYARMCKFSGWFIICLKSSHTGGAIYVLEFFWPTSNDDYGNIQTRLNKLLGMMEDKLGNFKFPSDVDLGHLSSVLVFENDQKIPYFCNIQATRTFSQDSDPSTEQSSASVSSSWRC